jgi:plasmid replication initiation protein
MVDDRRRKPLTKVKPRAPRGKRIELFAVVDSWSPRSDRHSLEHPIFSISKTPDQAIRHYESPDKTVHLTVFPSAKGSATIWDKDILIYIAGIIRAKLNAGASISSHDFFEINSHNLLEATCRSTGGSGYSLLEDALDRLSGTRLRTDIETRGKKIKDAFGIIERWTIVEKDNVLIRFEVKLSEWFFNSIVSEQKEVLAISREYFELVGGIERRIYEICRKHCGAQGKWEISLLKLKEKIGVVSELRGFRRAVRAIVAKNLVPDYLLTFDNDMLCCYSRNFQGLIESLHPRD